MMVAGMEEPVHLDHELIPQPIPSKENISFCPSFTGVEKKEKIPMLFAAQTQQEMEMGQHCL
jgi:hypothetical protein